MMLIVMFHLCSSPLFLTSTAPTPPKVGQEPLQKVYEAGCEGIVTSVLRQNSMPLYHQNQLVLPKLLQL